MTNLYRHSPFKVDTAQTAQTVPLPKYIRYKGQNTNTPFYSRNHVQSRFCECHSRSKRSIYYDIVKFKSMLYAIQLKMHILSSTKTAVTGTILVPFEI